MCQEIHKNAVFPVSLPLKSLMKFTPAEVYRSDLVEDFKLNLNKIQQKKSDLETCLETGVDKVKEHCIELRLDVDLATETAVEEIKQHRETVIKQINEYEENTISLIKNEEKTKNEFKESINSMIKFTNEWKSYLTKAKIEDKQVTRKNFEAIEMIKKAEKDKRKLDSFIFNKKMIIFEKNKRAFEMGNIGVVKFKSTGGYDLNEFKKINILNGGHRVQVYPLYDGTFYLLCTNNSNNVLNQITIDKEHKIISPFKKFNCGYIFTFKKRKEKIFILYNNSNGYRELSILNLDFSIFRAVDSSYSASCLSASDTHVYTYYNKQLYMHKYDLILLKQVGQQTDPNRPFYLPPEIKQFEINRGKIYLLSNISLQILKEDNGKLAKTVEIAANDFIIDSEENIVLYNTATKEINYFDECGSLIDAMPMENYISGLRISSSKDCKPLFYSDTALFIID